MLRLISRIRKPSSRVHGLGQPSIRAFWFWSKALALRQPQCIYQGFSQHNEAVTVLQVPEDPENEQYKSLAGSRVLILDRSGNVHSVYHPTRVLTGSYWDVLATLPTLVPPGPMGLLGLGAGTIPRIIAAHYSGSTAVPGTTGGKVEARGGEGEGRGGIEAEGGGAAAGGGGSGGAPHVVHGWELDPGVVVAARMHLGMTHMERSGRLVVHVGDALSPDASLPGGFTGLIVDLFSEGRLLPQLTERSTWESIRARLTTNRSIHSSSSNNNNNSGNVEDSSLGVGGSRSGGACCRVIANLGLLPSKAEEGEESSRRVHAAIQAYEAMSAAFGGDVSVMAVQENLVALTGPVPGPEEWPGWLPADLQHLASELGPWTRDGKALGLLNQHNGDTLGIWHG